MGPYFSSSYTTTLFHVRVKAENRTRQIARSEKWGDEERLPRRGVRRQRHGLPCWTNFMAGKGCDPNEDGLERLLQVSGVVRLVAEPKFLIL